jgi:integrase
MTRRRSLGIGIGIYKGTYRWWARIEGSLEGKAGFPLTAEGLQACRAARQAAVEAAAAGCVILPEGSFAAEVERYKSKPKIAHMASLDERAAHLELWLRALGRDRHPRSITGDDVEAMLQHWLTTLAPATVYHRRTALGSFFDTLYPGTPNPVRGTTRPDHYRPVDKSIPFATIARILAAMPDTRIRRKGIRTPSFAKLRVTVIAETGIPPAELVKLKARDFDRVAGIVRMPWRDKGAGTPAHLRHLSPEGVAAFVALDAAGAWGWFPGEALARSFKRAARRVCGADTPITLYWLRHSFGADTYRTTNDLAAVGRALGHRPGSICTPRYAMGANAEVDRAAMAAVSAARRAVVAATEIGPVSALKLVRKVGPIR